MAEQDESTFEGLPAIEEALYELLNRAATARDEAQTVVTATNAMVAAMNAICQKLQRTEVAWLSEVLREAVKR